MTINQHLPWPIKFALFAVVIGVGGAIAMWTYDLGRSFAFGPKFSPEQMTELQDKVASLTAERDKLQAAAATIDSQQNIEKSIQKQLTDQINTLTAENNRIKDDLAFFESLMPSANRPQGITLQKTKIELTGPNQLRYRALVMQGGKVVRDFSGEMHISLTLVQEGKPVMMEFPDPKSGEAAKLKLSFKHYQRIEGQITLPEGAVVKSAQMTVLEKGELRAKQAVQVASL
ncbi:DUF6776 family protein [Undibacterium danionis]|uniref:DUF6776 family protein n=1 Tax=Undibacterium danionis TaxID=1812100 RepID=A0ABV6ICH1_9BURK